MRTRTRYLLAACTAALLVGFQSQAARAGTSNLERRVSEELARYYPGKPLFVTVKKTGDVIIQGTVSNYWDKLETFQIASHVPGVQKVSDQVEVQTDLVPDDEIRANINQGLRLSKAVLEPDHIHVAVDRGTVILTGTVSFSDESMAAGDIASWTDGVRGMVNHIQVLPPKKAVSDENLTAIANDLLVRFFPKERKTVHVRVENGLAMLSGTVRDPWARRSMAREIRQVHGIFGVENHLQSGPVL